MGLQPARDLVAFVVHRQHEEAAARGHDHADAGRLVLRRQEGGERRAGDVARDPVARGAHPRLFLRRILRAWRNSRVERNGVGVDVSGHRRQPSGRLREGGRPKKGQAQGKQDWTVHQSAPGERDGLETGFQAEADDAERSGAQELAVVGPVREP